MSDVTDLAEQVDKILSLEQKLAKQEAVIGELKQKLKTRGDIHIKRLDELGEKITEVKELKQKLAVAVEALEDANYVLQNIANDDRLVSVLGKIKETK